MDSIISYLFALGKGEFFERYLGKEILINKLHTDYLGEIFDSQPNSLNDLLYIYSERPELIRVANKGDTYPAPRIADGRLNIYLLLDSFYRGSSLVINSVHRFNRRIKDVADHLAFEFGLSVQANYYLTPSNSQAFSTHFDSHDVIVVQVLGKKKWEIFEFPEERTSSENNVNSSENEYLERTKIYSGVLDPGSVLYIPRGQPHKAIAATETSLHITFSLNSLSKVDLVKKALDICASGAYELNQHTLVGDSTSAEIMDSVSDILLKLLSNDDVWERVRRSVEDEVSNDIYHFPSICLDANLDSYTFVRIKPCIHFRIHRESEELVVTLNSYAKLRVAEQEGSFLIAIYNEGPIYINEFKKLMEGRQLHVFWRFIAMGIIELV